MEINVDKLDTQIKLSGELYMFKEAYRNDAMKNLVQNYEAIKEAIVANKFKSTTANDDKYGATIKITNLEDKYVIGFGIKKAEAILDQLEELKAFVEANKTSTVDADKLNDEQKDLVQTFIKK